jgi:tripartite-type tricarboxylate transporter receptor subunit TctC
VRTSTALIAISGLLLAAVAPAVAQTWPTQTWPTKPIHFVIPYQPGGIVDTVARVIAPKLTEAWGQPVVIENKPGASGFIGMTHVVKSPPDGYTYVLATLGDFTVNPALFKDIPYSVERDLAPVATLTSTPTLFTVGADAPYKTVADVIADAKARPGKISYATPGNGSINQIVMESLSLNTGTKFQHIPYKGGAPASTAVAAGDLPVGLLAHTGALPYIRAGKIRVLAAASDKRVASNPEWSTLREAGLLEIDGSNWTGMMAPRDTPPSIIEKMNAELSKILAMPDVQKRLETSGGVTIPATVAEVAQRIRAETTAYGEIVRKASIQPQ